MRAPSFLLLPLLVGAVACGDGAPAAPRRFWSMAELERESTLSNCDNPGGLPCNYFVKSGKASTPVVQFKLAFSERQPMGYMTTDFWANYDRIWLQPMYILVTAWNENPPAMNRLVDANKVAVGPIFSVGPQSAFSSPFWSVYYVVVPDTTPPGKYTSARQLFADNLEMHQGANRFASIAPDDLSLPSQDELLFQFPHFADYLKNGEADVPLFVFVHRVPNPDGTPNYLGAPNVGGVGPIFGGAVAKLADTGRPQFGALWRLHLVTVPAGTDYLTPEKAATSADPTPFADKVYRVALNGATCFDDLVSGKGDACTPVKYQ